MRTEKRLIDVNEAKKIAKEHLSNPYEIISTCAVLDRTPTVDAVEVVHERWEDMWGGKYANPRFRCSVCKTKALYINVLNGLGNWIDEQELSNYCPNCGAKMDGDGNESSQM